MSDGMSALYVASEAGNGDAVESLLAHKANPNVATTSGNTPLYAAVQRDDADIAGALIEAGSLASFNLYRGSVSSPPLKKKHALHLYLRVTTEVTALVYPPLLQGRTSTRPTVVGFPR